MLHARGISKSDDLLRDYLEIHEPSIEIISFPYYQHSLFMEAETKNAVLISVKQYFLDFPGFLHIDADWDFPVERGIFYHRNCRTEVKNFISLAKQFIKEFDL